MDIRRATETSLEGTLEKAVAWGLPVAPLLTSMLFTLATTPARRAAGESTALYLICILGAFVGFATCTLPKMSDRRMRGAMCLGAACTLEAAWIILSVGGLRSIVACTWIGTFLVGLSTAVLLVLWLGIGQAASMRAEFAKYSVALFAAFVLYALTSVFPVLGWISFAFPFATAIPLFMALREVRPADVADGASSQPTSKAAPRAGSGRGISRIACLAFAVCLLALFGAGIGVLGFDAPPTDYSLVIAAVVLLVPTLIGSSSAGKAIGQIAAPLAVAGLCLGFLLDVGSSYAVFLAGCGLFVIWQLTSLRCTAFGRLARLSQRQIALALGCCNAAVAIGLLVILTLPGSTQSTSTSAVLIATLIILADLAWRLSTQAAESAVPVIASATGRAERSLFESTYGLTPRETDVALLLCENRSIGFMCATLELANSTVKTHVRHVYEKTGVHSKSELQLLVGDALSPSGANMITRR